MNELYDEIGKTYSVGRRTDPFIASQINTYLNESESIINIGAGTGSYEPKGKNLVALEPSELMIKQRPKISYPVKQGKAEALPFKDKSFSHAMTVLSMHHWKNRIQAFEEIKRVTRERFIAVTWCPESEPFWLTRDYFPEIHDIDKAIFPNLGEITKVFDSVNISPLLIPSNCIDGFLAAYWRRPYAYLEPIVRQGISTFARISDLENGLLNLQKDLDSGRWNTENHHLSELANLDTGYKIIECIIK